MTSFLDMDAGEQREFLARELADWIEAEFWSYPATKEFYRRVKILARSVGMRFAKLMDTLRADAEWLLDEQAHQGAGR
jgi:hypothetical protein